MLFQKKKKKICQRVASNISTSDKGNMSETTTKTHKLIIKTKMKKLNII